MEFDTIVSIASGMGGGIGIIRISGDTALNIAGSIFHKKNNNIDSSYFINADSHTIHYGFVVDEKGNDLDEVMVLVMKNPSSYTKEDVIEIDCHGGTFILQKILKTVLHAGARLAQPGEFTKRAFLNGRIDLSQAEAVMNLIASKNDYAMENALHQLEGSVSKYIEDIRQSILYEMSFIESALDDPEHYDLEGYSQKLHDKLMQHLLSLEKLLQEFDNGRMKTEGINTVIVGKPNAGKSSFMNLLLDEERAIVTDIAGTTRDALVETVKLGDLLVNLVDTAGIHETDDYVENIGVKRAVSYLEKADFIIFMVDQSESLSQDDLQIISLIQEKKGVILLNKSDLSQHLDCVDLSKRLPWKQIIFSAKTRAGYDEFLSYFQDRFISGTVQYNDQIVLSNIRHKEVIEQAVINIKAVLQTIEEGMPEDFYTIDLMDAYKNLGLINGETASEDLVNSIFEKFCMGK